MAITVEGIWDELVKRDDLRGRRVRITVLDEPAGPAAAAPAKQEEDPDAWVKSLEKVVKSRKEMSHTHESEE